MSKLPRLGPRLPAGGGWTIQGLYLSNVSPVEEMADGFYAPHDCQRGYVKIFNPMGSMVDTALTLASARKRIKLYKRSEIC